MDKEEKANELIEKFKDFSRVRWSDLSGYDKKDLLKNQIECALILCDEILKYLSLYGTKHDFWQGVKEKLVSLKDENNK